ncbi:MAG: hypothetical protein ACTS43_00495 [Candidatus Hodgkinia cicadicola]
MISLVANVVRKILLMKSRKFSFEDVVVLFFEREDAYADKFGWKLFKVWTEEFEKI